MYFDLFLLWRNLKGQMGSCITLHATRQLSHHSKAKAKFPTFLSQPITILLFLFMEVYLYILGGFASPPLRAPPGPTLCCRLTLSLYQGLSSGVYLCYRPRARPPNTMD